MAFVLRNPAEARWRPFVVELKAGGTAAEAVALIREREGYSPPSFPDVDPILDGP
jgi:hypothetical protein